MLCENALRRAELRALDVSDIDLVKGRLRITRKGRSEPECVTLDEPTAAVLVTYINAQPRRTGAVPDL